MFKITTFQPGAHGYGRRRDVITVPGITSAKNTIREILWHSGSTNVNRVHVTQTSTDTVIKVYEKIAGNWHKFDRQS